MEVLSLSELRWPGQGTIKTDSYTNFHSGPTSSNVHGVGIVFIPHACSTWGTAYSYHVDLAERMLLPYRHYNYVNFSVL